MQFEKYFGKIPFGFLHKGTLGCINPSSSKSINTKPHWQLNKPNFFVSRLHDKFLFDGFLKTRSVLRMPTLGFPALLVTSRISFTFPCALHTSSSSSLVQENGKPDIKSLCFSRVVLYLNTWRTKMLVHKPARNSKDFKILHPKSNSCLWDAQLPQSHE